MLDLIPNEAQNAAKRHFQQIITHGWAVDQVPYVRKDGSQAFWTVSAVLLSEDRLLGFAQDITERIRAETELQYYSTQLEEIVEQRTEELRNMQEQLLRQERLAVVGQLAGSIGHELRNPPGVISNAVYFLTMIQADADKTVREYLDIMVTEIRRSEKIIADLLSLSRSGVAERRPREEVHLAELVAQVLAERAPPESMNLSIELDPDLPTIEVDPQQIHQVIANLVANAYQAMESNGTLTIGARVRRTRLVLMVEDTGAGITAEHLDRLFEPLFTTKPRGIGLGLTISKGRVEANGGEIDVHSTPGVGTTFEVSLPIAVSRKTGQTDDD